MGALTLFAVFGVSLACFCVLERVMHAILTLFHVRGDESGDKGLRAGLVVGSLLELVSAMLSAALGFALRCVSLLGWLVVWFALFYCLSALWFVLYEDHAEVVIYAADFYSRRVGPLLHGYLFLPLDLLNLMLKGLLPLYNGVVWVVRGLLTKGLLPILWDELGLLVDFGVGLFELFKGASYSVVEFVGDLDCGDLSCIERPPSLDLVTPMGSVRDLAVVASRFGAVVCSTISLPLDWVLYPLVDPRFAKAVHSLSNFVLHLGVHTPRSATKRCDAYGRGGLHWDVLMCTPDLEPAFDLAVSGLRDLGGAVDNWLGVGAAMARRSLTGLPDDCRVRALVPGVFRGELLSGLQTVVGLTDWLTAASNGSHAYFWGQVTTDTSVRQWLEPVDVRMGLAAVSFDEAGEVEVSGVTQGQRPAARQTTSILGCRCLDTSEGMVVRCGVLPLHGAARPSTHAFDVLFQDRTWASQMDCRGAEVSVRSVRWPVRRYEGKSVPFAAGFTDLPGSDCMTRASCESVDATIWLVPRCDALRPEQCSDAAVGTSCYPFCMAARVSGSRNANPVFVNAETWRAGKQLLMRDCALSSARAAASAGLRTSESMVATLGFGQTTLSGASAGGLPIFVSGLGDGSQCQTGANMASWVPSNASAADPRSVPAYMRRRGQPFAIAGDAVLMEFLAPDGASTVEVDRLSGNQRDVYTLVPGWAGLPTAPKLLVPAQELRAEERSRVVVPMDLVASRVPSASSRNFVFYAVSPDLRIFQAYLDYCRDRDALPRAQYMMLSSYSALRVYRVRAFCQETCEAGDLTAQYTFDGFSDGKFSAAEFPPDCSRVYNASIDALEYVNEQNLAVTVQVADRTYDPLLRQGSNSSFVTYWLNPQTMRVKTGGMWDTLLPSSLTAGLCVAGDGVPHVGSLGAELAVAGVHLLHRAVGALLYAPGMVYFWRGGSACPLESRGHSVLASCGQTVLSLDDFFDSLDAAAAILWGIPGWVAEQMEQGKVVGYSPVSDLLRGAGAYGLGAVGVSGLQGGVMSLLDTPLPEQLAGVYALVRQPGSLAGAAKVAGGASSWARFSARFFAVVGAQVASKLAVQGVLDLGELWRDMINTLYDHRPLFKSTVTDRGLSACVGLQLMLGGANPPSKLLYHSCLSSVRVVDGAMDLFLHAFADAPMVKCVCKDSAGHNAAKYAREHCIWRAPKSMQPTLYGMVAASEGLIGGDALLCPAVIAYTRRQLESTMSPYFETVFASLDALGDSVDYMLSGFDAEAGQCSNYRADPHVVVIMPEPVDYFRGCGATTYCRAKCAGNWEAFDAARAAYDPARLTTSRELERTVDSLFFPSVVAEMIAPGLVVALVRPDACGAWVCRSDADDCLAAAAVVGLELSVSYFCVPSSPSSVVYATDEAGLAWSSEVGHDSPQVSFLQHDGSSMVVMTETQIVLLRRGQAPKVVMDISQVLSLPLVGKYPLRIVSFLPVRQRLLVNVAVRTSQDNKFERDVGTLWFSPLDVVDVFGHVLDFFPAVIASPAMKDLWNGYAASEYPAYDADSVAMILWPVSLGGSMKRVFFDWSNTTVTARVEPIAESQSLVARATLIPRKLVLSKTLREDTVSRQLAIYASAGNVYDWLRQLRLTGDGLAVTSASLSNAQPVRAVIAVNTSCDGLDCRGCPDLSLRSLCSAYQSCSVFKCIGTPVNLKRPLCGVGQALKSVGNLGVTNVQGAWVMFVDIFMILLQLKTVNNLPGVDVTFPDDSFMSNICAAKDVSAEFFSILTSTVNSVLQKVQKSLTVFAHFSVVDSSVNTMISLSVAAITGFLHQLALAPVYVLSVGHKIMMCQVSGFLAVTSHSGLRVNIQPARFSSTDAISGQCLTVGAEVDAQQTGDAGAVRGMTSHAAEVLTGSGQAAVMRRLEPYMHMVDGALTYLIGAVAKFADLLQTLDVQHCVLPDVTLKDTVRCACGDQPLSIGQPRKAEGLEAFAYWCTGTITLVDGDNQAQVVWNPYTYGELQEIVGGRLDQYVVAASASVTVDAPNDVVFAEQGVSMFAVLTRCRQNFVNKQWDPSAFVRYDAAFIEREVKGSVQVALGDPADGVGQCLLDSVESGAGNGACLDSFLRLRGHSDLYWGYDTANHSISSHLLDACLVFSGPASNVRFSDARRAPFQNCLTGYSNASACDLSGFVWSPASSNDVPVAVRHTISAKNGSHLEDAAERRMMVASEMVMSKLRALANYSNEGLEAALFSAEGDVIHQLMDCVFMGPYARVDYWPAPRCDEGERDDCLVGPYWSRDENRGKTRKVDLDTCTAAASLPFTCGSPTRKAMVRDFVRQYLEEGSGGADLVAELVRRWIQDQAALWYYDPARFSCDCEDCCDGHLPRVLSLSTLQLPTGGVMNALEDRLRRFYSASMSSPEPWISELDSEEIAKYDWSASGGSSQILTHAAFHPSKPTQRYDESEAASPSSTYSAPSLWLTCHAALKQVFFTMPVSDDGRLRGSGPAAEFSGGGPETIAAHVKGLVESARHSSPLFRHYQPRHHPSESRMCSGAASQDARVARGSVRFSDYAVGGNVVLDGSTVPPIPTLAYDAGVLGARWQGSLPGLNEHLGFLDRDATEKWLRGQVNLTTSGEFLLRYGPGGLKAGNVPGVSSANLSLPDGYAADLDAVLREHLRESDRVYPVDSAALHGCEEHSKNTLSLLGDFVDGLFPMAQGVRESGVGAYCLRFALELAMLYAMELVPELDAAHVIAQKEQVVAWRRRCGTQVQLIGMCSALGLYRAQSLQPTTCMFSWYLMKDPDVEMYLTPECLVKMGDVFYDPCQCKPDWCEPRNTTQVITRAALLESEHCKVGFDPRSVVQAAELGWWGEDETDESAAAWNEWLSDPVNLLDMPSLRSAMLRNGQSAGNAPVGSHWATAEGFMNETGAFCDMISDYWPEDAAFPVGYHVTTPCHMDDAGYRSFDNVFALELRADGVPILSYMEDQTRDASLVDSHFGAGGLCRGTNFAMDMYETNTMRVCTRLSDGEDVDIHVPRGKSADSTLGLPRCSESSKELPWADSSFYEFYDAALFSVGTVPSLPSESAALYPESSDRYMHVGPQHAMASDGWGDACQDFELPSCRDGAWECPGGFICRGDGVCQHPSVECVSHSDCAAQEMCSGLGTCEAPVVTVDNQLGEDVSFRAHTAACPGEAFSMRGASYWGYVPDLLEAHGMCSYRKWQEYLYTMDRCCDPVASTSAQCQLRGASCDVYKFSRDASVNKWWNTSDNAPTRLKMIPTTCDRDYERFSLGGREMKSCVPGPSDFWLLKPDETYQQVAERDKLWRVYDDTTRTVSVMQMPFKSRLGDGFISGKAINNIKSCMSIRQCFSDQFTKNGRPSMLASASIPSPNRTVWGSSQLYDPNDQFRCGAIGYYDKIMKKCVVDTKLFPIYYVLCRQSSGEGLGQCRASLKKNALPARCDNVKHEYDPDFNTINDVIVPALNEFFYVFETPASLAEHLDLVQCLDYVYGVMSSSQFDSKGLYVPFTFTLYEFPFPWFYQCIIGSDIRVGLNFDRKLYDCTNFRARVERSTVLTATTPFSSYVFKVRGGYVKSVLEAERTRQASVFRSAWEFAVEEVRALLFQAGNSKDLTSPKCFTEMHWNIPNDDRFKRKMIEAYVRNTCASNLLSVYVQQYNQASGKAVDTQSAIDELVKLAGAEQDQRGVLTQNRLLTGLIKRYGVDKLAQQTSLAGINDSFAPIRMNYEMPPSASPDFQQTIRSWATLSGVLPSSVKEILVEQPNCCELKDLYVDSRGYFWEEEDTDWQSGSGNRVKVYNVYARGYFGCAYPDIQLDGKSVTLKGNDSDVEASFYNYVTTLYLAVKKRYDLKMAQHVSAGTIGSIPMSALKFYDDEASLGFTAGFQFDLTNVANYVSNINPDVRTPVMCVAGNQQVDFNKCSDPNFYALKNHVYSKYSAGGGVVVPDKNQLDWTIRRSMMTDGAIFSFASVSRNTSKRFLNRMFDEDTVCGASSTLSSRDKLCYFEGQNALMNRSVIAPWMGGGWNPFDKCDVRQLDLQSGNAEVVDSLCYYNAYCPKESGYDTLTVPYYRHMPNPECSGRDNERTQNINVNSRFLYNLCMHKLNEDSVCNHSQGMLGGGDGSPIEDYDVDGGLFDLHEFSAWPPGTSSLYGGALLSGGDADYGFLKSGGDHIGGHQIGMRVQPDATLRVAKMPLKPVRGKAPLDTWDSLDTRLWMPGVSQKLAEDDLEYSKSTRDVGYVVGMDARGKPMFSWDCPLRRRAFYTGSVENFKPQLPSARRSRRLFGNVTGGAWAHPTQRRQDASARFGPYKTTNGFCFCPTAEEVWPGMCGVDTRLREEHNCSLYQTVQAIRGASWGWSHTFRPRNRQNEPKACGVQLDWPFVQGVLRDNATVGHDDVDASVWDTASDVEGRKCHVLDRIPDFAYVYVSKRELRKSGYTTLSRGACHTGRVQGRLESSKRCVRLLKESRESTLRCADNTNAKVPRNVSKAPPESARASLFYRRRCSRCTPPPAFATRDGHPLPSETSFGLPYRVSAERALARDLREALCSTINCSAALNATAWRKGEFLQALMSDPKRLFVAYVDHTNLSSSYEPRRGSMPSDERLWARKWVYCPTRESLRTSVGCNGTLSKERWRANKVGACYSTISDALKGRPDPFASTDICNLDSRLGELCVAIREAQSLVASTNCIRSGDKRCSLQEYVYSPSTWESNNQAFVHQTVQEYYMRIDGCTNGTDCVCQADSALSRLRANNSYRLRECSAVSVMLFRDVLVQARTLVYSLCKVTSLVVDIAFNLLLMLSPSSRDVATSNIVLSWAKLKQESSVVVYKLSDMLFDMIFSVGNFGPYLKRGYMSACKVINEGYAYAADVWCNLIVEQLPLFLGALRSIGGWMEVGFSVVNDVFTVILDDQLPDALMELYQYGYREYFQSVRYREKQAAYEERKEASLLNEKENKDKKKTGLAKPDNRFLQNLGRARDKRLQRSTVNSAMGVLGALGALGRMGGVLDVAITAKQLYDDVQTARQIKEMLEKFPTSFTLFDFDDFYLSIDGLVEFLNADFTCYSMSVNVTPLQCTLLDFTEPSQDDVDLMAPRASVCWAEAQERQVGVSNLYSCTATSSCCVDPLNCDDSANGVRLCSECPLPPAGVRTYGCNTMLQRCQCGVESFQVARCGSQGDCGPAASCSLLTSLDDVSFGALRSCTECAASPICLMGSSQVHGLCTCLTSTDSKVDLCSVPVGTRVNPSASKLCGFARDPGGYYAWSELSLVMCVNALAPVCAEVMSETGALIYMSVSTRLRTGQVGYSSRRLLSVDDGAEPLLRLPSALLPEDPSDDVTPDMIHRAVTGMEWNHTAAPCSSLAVAYRLGKELGPVDESALHSCVYWRVVAKQLIEEHSLVALRGFDTFLLSTGDFSASLGQRGVLQELLFKPWVLAHAALYSEWLKPVRAALVASHDANVTATIKGWSAKIARQAKRVRKELDLQLTLPSDLLDFASENSSAGGGRGRRLLGVWEETRDKLRAMPYYSLIRSTVSSENIFDVLNLTAMQLWRLDAFFWRGVDFGKTCPIADTTSSLVKHSLRVSNKYYAHFTQLSQPPLVRRRFREVLPNVAAYTNFSANVQAGRQGVLNILLDIVGLRMSDVVGFLSQPCPQSSCQAENRWTASYLAESMLFCDLESVVMCTDHKNDLVTSTLLMVLVYVALSLLCSYLGVSALSTLFFLAIPVLAVWYSLGVSVRCFPMIPTCLLDDTIASLKSLLPVKASLPRLLVMDGQDLRSCSELNFTTWEDPLAFVWCDLGFCESLADTTVFWELSRWNFAQMHAAATGVDADAHRVCASVTAAYAVPVLLVATAALTVCAAAALSLLSMLGPVLGLLWQVVLFDHYDN